MGRQLYKTEPVFRDTLNQCAAILDPELECSSLNLLYPQPESKILSGAERSLSEAMPDKAIDFEAINPKSKIHQTAYTQPALFALEYALAQLWRSWGVKPDIVLGHSVGEYVAACIAGVFSLEAGLKLIAARGRLMQSLPPGGEMLSLLAPSAEVEQWIEPYQEEVAIAAVNGPHSVVISGARQAIQAIETDLRSKGTKVKKLQVSHAFHSPLMDPMLADFEALAQTVSYSPPQIPLISCVTGQPATDDMASPDYWVRHVKQPVNFLDGMARLHEVGVNCFLEIGPTPLLLGMGRQCLPDKETAEDASKRACHWLPSLRPGQEDGRQMLHSLAELYVNGATVDWVGFHRNHPRRKVSLPTYPFQRQRYWIDRDQPSSLQIVQNNRSIHHGQSQPTNLHPLLGQRFPLSATNRFNFRPD